jgi:hypothetical protein
MESRRTQGCGISRSRPAVGSRLWLCLCVVSLFSPPAGTTEPISKGTLSGRIVDANGKPISQARVWTEIFDAKSRSRKLLAEARSDHDGRFRLGPVDAVYRQLVPGLRIEADGFASQCIPSRTLSIFPGLDCDLGTIPLDRGRVFTGTVIDFDGKPAVGASVTAESCWDVLGHTIGAKVTAKGVTTDVAGRFRTPPLPVGRLALTVQVPDRQLADASLRTIAPGGDEDVGTIRLDKDVPVEGVVRDEKGTPIAGVHIGGTVGHEATTDEQGRFVLRGFGPNPSFQMNVNKAGYALLVGIVRVTKDGARYGVVRGGDLQDKKPAKILTVVLRRAGTIEGEAVDADTGAPVRLDRVEVRDFQRKPDGEVVLRYGPAVFGQSELGRFRVTFSSPNEYHLTFIAAGYHNADAYTPKVTELKTIGGIVAKMKKKSDGSIPTVATQSIAGRVTRDGQALKSGWAALWELRRPADAINSPVRRGRTVVGDAIPRATAPIHDGTYRLEVPFQNENWYVVVEEPGHPLTQVGPVSIALKEHKTLDITCSVGGHIRGRVTGIPPGWDGHIWVVAFSKTAVFAEVRVGPDGRFVMPALPPGEYGLKAGHDGYSDAEVFPGALARGAGGVMADPWKRARLVKVAPGRDTVIVEVQFPE